MSPSESISSLEFDSQRQQQAIALVGRVEALENRIHSSFSADEHKQYFLTDGSRRINGQVIIDYTGTEALLVRKNNDGGDVFTVNTSTAGVLLAGTLGVTGDTTIDGKQIIDVTDTEALLVRKNADGGDVLIVDTTNKRVGVNVVPSYPFHVVGTTYITGTTTFVGTLTVQPTGDYIGFVFNGYDDRILEYIAIRDTGTFGQILVSGKLVIQTLNSQPIALISASTVDITGDIYPETDNTYYLGRNDDDSPKAFKGVILKDTTNGKYYRIEVINGTVTATDLTD